MSDASTAAEQLGSWSTPQCPFTITYSRRTLDDIRLAVVDAYFSLPRGGAEIGGVLLGKFENNQLMIADHLPLECEHLFGPGFKLSPADQARLSETLTAAAPHENGLRPVGWYHSHTRSEIFLSDDDLEIHQRYFPEPWQVALVLKPSTMELTRAGFFFREGGGSISANAAYQEWQLEPLGVIPAALPQPNELSHNSPSPNGHDGVAVQPDGLVITAVAEAVPEPLTAEAPTKEMERPQFAAFAAAATAGSETTSVSQLMLELPAPAEPVEEPLREPMAAVETAAAESEPEPITGFVPQDPSPEPQNADLHPKSAAGEIPPFLDTPPSRSRRWVWVAVGLAAVAASGVLGYQRRNSWVPQVNSAAQKAAQSWMPRVTATPAPPVVSPVRLGSVDHEGQLQFQWDNASPTVAQAREGVLEIADNGKATEIPLDRVHLSSGGFTYARQGERVEAKLTVKTVDGRQVESATSFIGPLPQAPPSPQPVESPEARKRAGELARKNEELEQQLAALQQQNLEWKKKYADLGKQRDDLAKQTARLKTELGKKGDLTKETAKLKEDLSAETSRSRKLQQQVDQIQKQQQKKRMVNQSFDPLE